VSATLIEVIVVLVILAILAAIAIPALTGYIDKANQRAAISQAASIRTALQTFASEDYRTGSTAPDTTTPFTGETELEDAFPNYSPISTITDPKIADEVTALTGTTYGATDLKNITYGDNRVLTGFALHVGDYWVVFDGDGYTSSKDEPDDPPANPET
jgi:prepilin-type N-terminal cleavage/methylation domain-containing protein